MPDINVPRDSDLKLTYSERVYRSLLADTVTAVTMSGTTANRPVTFLWVGRPYFDITIQRPIWLRDLSPAVWIRADGVVV